MTSFLLPQEFHHSATVHFYLLPFPTGGAFSFERQSLPIEVKQSGFQRCSIFALNLPGLLIDCLASPPLTTAASVACSVALIFSMVLVVSNDL